MLESEGFRRGKISTSSSPVCAGGSAAKPSFDSTTFVSGGKTGAPFIVLAHGGNDPVGSRVLSGAAAAGVSAGTGSSSGFSSARPSMNSSILFLLSSTVWPISSKSFVSNVTGRKADSPAVAAARSSASASSPALVSVMYSIEGSSSRLRPGSCGLVRRRPFLFLAHVFLASILSSSSSPSSSLFLVLFLFVVLFFVFGLFGLVGRLALPARRGLDFDLACRGFFRIVPGRDLVDEDDLLGDVSGVLLEGLFRDELVEGRLRGLLLQLLFELFVEVLVEVLGCRPDASRPRALRPYNPSPRPRRRRSSRPGSPRRPRRPRGTGAGCRSCCSTCRSRR